MRRVMMTWRLMFGWVMVGVCAGLIGCGAGTSIQIGIEVGDGDGADDGIPAPPTGPITVILVNETSLSVDPHVYVSESKLTAEELFGDERNLFANFDGATVIASESNVSITFECSKLGTIGSNQAIYASWTNLGAAGKSEESPVIQIGETANAPVCGQVLIIRFFRDDGDGKYHTKWRTVDPDELQ